jgi:uncharacterized protein YebE (UPF0316 family)
MDSPAIALWPLVGIPLLIFCARLIDVTLSTIRIVFVARGLRTLAPFIGFFEILVWLVAIGQVMQHLDRPLNYFAYAGGFAAGTGFGLLLEEKMAIGLVAVRTITRHDASALTETLQEAKYGVTSFAARGVKGRVRLLLTVVPRRDLNRVQDLVKELNPNAFVSVEDVRQAREGFFPTTGSRVGLLFRRLRQK